MGRKLTKEELYNKILNKCVDIDCSKVNVIKADMKLPITLICPIHGEYIKTIHQILYKNHKCPECTKLEKNKKIKQTKLERYGNENYNNYEKNKQTCLEKYNVDNVFKLDNIHQKGIQAAQSEEVKEKRKQTNLKLYNVDNPFKSDIIKNKIKHTNIEKYGVSSYSQTDEFKEKLEQTCLDKFGVKSNLNLPEVKEKVKTRINTHEARIKASKTMRENGNKSKLETKLENFLLLHNISYIIEYNKDKRYPFHCDFYLPDNDIFIEINGYWVHGGHWFNKNDLQDIKKLSIWKEKAKTSNFYKYAIKVWTQQDLKKYEYAKKNNLNYIVLWNYQDIDNFITKILKEEVII